MQFAVKSNSSVSNLRLAYNEDPETPYASWPLLYLIGVDGPLVIPKVEGAVSQPHEGVLKGVVFSRSPVKL